MPVTLLVFTLSGALAGLAGIIYASRFGYVNPGITGVGFEFTVIAAVVIGGVSINGGVGSVLGHGRSASSSSAWSTWRCRSSASPASGRTPSTAR